MGKLGFFFFLYYIQGFFKLLNALENHAEASLFTVP